jgi:hypothetical protein
MIISETIGSRAQINLIDLNCTPDQECKWVLHYIDHFSGFSKVAALPDRLSRTVGAE